MISAIHESIGRLVVRLVWARYAGQLKLAGGVLALILVAGGYLLTRRVPPEG